jgi:diacylglycerol kinase (ATP)
MTEDGAGRLRRVGLVVNPTSGKGRGKRYATTVAERLTQRGIRVRTIVGRDAVEALDLARGAVAEGIDGLVVLGGDGMVHLGVQAVAGSPLPLGIVAAGTGNDFARLLGLPIHEPVAGADVVADWQERAIDAGRVLHHSEQRWFAGVLSSGFDSLVNERANRMTWPRGRMRYNVAIVAELSVFHALPFTLVLDGEQIETEAMLVAVGNGQSYGGGMRVCPGAAVDDGLLSVTVLSKISKPEFLRVFPSVYKGAHVQHPAVTVHEARRVDLASPGAMAYADGERIAALPLAVEAVPGALRVLVPAVRPGGA